MIYRRHIHSIVVFATLVAALILLPAGAEGTVYYDRLFVPEEVTEETPVMMEGIIINGTDMSGKTLEEALELTKAQISEALSSKVVLHIGGESLTYTWQELGGRISEEAAEDFCHQAIELGKCGGGLLSRYMTDADIRYGQLTYESKCSVNQKTMYETVYGTLTSYNKACIDAALTFEGGVFSVSPDTTGVTVQVADTIELISGNVPESGLLTGCHVNVDVEYTEARVKTADLTEISDVLGQCTTHISGDDDRVHNVKLGSSNISGTLLLPGESASASDLMKKRTEENGYRPGGQYVDGQTVEGIGGGVCQVSSTLYNALLGAEVQIDERHNHSMSVSYLDPSKDAAIAEGYKDLKFTNNLDYAIYIYAETVGRELTFTIYGREDRPENRQVEYNSVVTFTWTTPDNVVYDPSQPIGYRHTTGSNHKEIKSYLEKVVYIDGAEVSREVLHKDYYLDSVRTITIGTGGLTKEEYLALYPQS